MLYNSIAPQRGEYRNIFFFFSSRLIVYLASFLQVSYLLLITETLEVTILDKFPNAVYIPSHTFCTIEDGRIFLFDNARYTDDCNKQLDIDVSTPDAACGETIFDAVVSDPCCSPTNPLQT